MKSNDVHIATLGTDCSLSITVHLTRRLRVRMWLACQLLRLAARVLGCAIEITEQSPPEGTPHA